MDAIIGAVAGGMSAGGGVPIGQRPVFTGPVNEGPPVNAGRPDEGAGAVAAAVASPVPGIVAARHPHVWVQDDVSPGQVWPGLVIEQGRDAAGTWLAHVVMVRDCGGGARTTVSGWVASVLS